MANWLIGGTRECESVPAVLYLFSDVLHFCFYYSHYDVPVDETFLDTHLAKAEGLWMEQ